VNSNNLLQRLRAYRFTNASLFGRILVVFALAWSSTSAFAICTPSLSLTSIVNSAINSASNIVFFKTINTFLRTQIDYLQWSLLTRTSELIGFVSLVLLTIWILFQGYRIITGRSHQPMMALVGDTLKAVLVIIVATSMAASSSGIYFALTDKLVSAISETVNPLSSEGNSSPYEQIDSSLAQMDVMMGLIDALSDGASAATGEKSDPEVQAAKDRAKWFTGIGVAGPGVIGGTVLLLNKIAIGLFVGFGPLFILCLLFDYTKSLFQRWLFYGVGTVFSLAILAFMVSIASKVVMAVTASILAKYAVWMATCTTPAGEGITSLAMQQGGIGLILSTLIISAPPMAAAFFQGTLGQFAAYSAFGNIGAHSGGRQAQGLASGRMTGSRTGALVANNPTNAPVV